MQQTINQHGSFWAWDRKNLTIEYKNSLTRHQVRKRKRKAIKYYVFLALSMYFFLASLTPELTIYSIRKCIAAQWGLKYAVSVVEEKIPIHFFIGKDSSDDSEIL